MKRFLLFTLLLPCFLNVSAQFLAGNVIVTRIGNGTAPVDGAAMSFSLTQYTPSGALISITFLHATDALPNLGMTQSSSAMTEGNVSLSGDGRYLTVAGYNAPVGTPSVATGNHLGVIARVDRNRTVVASTSFIRTSGNAYVGDNFNAVTTDDGSGFWGSGNSGVGGTGGIRYIPANTSGAGTQISSSTLNTKSLRIISGQLYTSTGANTIKIGKVGTGAPITSGQTINNLTGLPTGAALDPYEFALLDADFSVPGPDLLYFCSAGATPGLYKYSFNGTTWTARGSLTGNLFGIAARFDCSGGVSLFVTRGTTGRPTELYSFTDAAAYNATITSNGSALASVGILRANSFSTYVYGGIAFAPTDGGYITDAQNIAAGNYNIIRVKSGGVATLTGNIVVYDRVVVEPGGTLIMGTNIISSPAGIGSTFELQSGGTVKIGSPYGITTSGTGAMGGNVQTCKRYYSSTANYEYNGTTIQITGDGLPDTLTATLKINNITGIGTSGVTLSQNTTVSGVLDLTNGKLTSSISGLLNIADNATAINYSTVTNNSFVVGPMKKTGDDDFIFPIGEGAEMHTITLVKVSGDAATDEFQVQYFKANPRSLFPGPEAPGTDHMSVLEYWMVNRNVGGASLIKKVKLQATTYTDATDLTRLVIINNPTGSAWQNDGRFASSGAYTGTVTSNNVTNFGPFTFASLDPYPTNPLPIKLISFDATKLANTKSSVNWELAACCSAAAKFEIQRANADKKFATIGTIRGSETNKLYNYIDNGLKNGINYYRLRMIDEDGKISYSRTVAIMNGVNGLLLTSLIPTIINDKATLTVASSNQQKLGVVILDMQGRVMLRRNFTITAGNTNIELSLSGLSAGAYQLTGISAEGKTNTIRFIRQ